MNDSIIFYSTHCPRCRALEMSLKKANIQYTESNNLEEMLAGGLTSAPGLRVDGRIMNFAEAMAWIKGGNYGDR